MNPIIHPRAGFHPGRYFLRRARPAGFRDFAGVERLRIAAFAARFGAFFAAVAGFFAALAAVLGAFLEAFLGAALCLAAGVPPRSCSSMAGFSSVDISWVICSSRATARNKRRMILPERVLGRLSVNRISSGLAIGLN